MTVTTEIPEITEDNIISTALHSAAEADSMLVVFADGGFTAGPRDLVEGIIATTPAEQVAVTFDSATVAGWIADAGGDWRAAVERFRSEIAA